MDIQNIDFDDIENEELENLSDQIDDLLDDFIDSADLIVNLCERAIYLARMEKKWYMFFVYYNTLFMEASCYGDPKKTIKHAEQFFLDCAQILPEAAAEYSQTNITEAVLNSFSSIFDTYKAYHQLTDQKLEEFMIFYKKTAVTYGQEFLFWHDVLEYGLDIADPDTVKRGYAGTKAHPFDGSLCYVCIVEEFLGYLIMTGQHEKARTHISKVIHRRIPVKYRSDYGCPRSNSAVQYRQLLSFYIRFGEFLEYRGMLEEGAAEMETYEERYGMCAEMAYHLAVSGRFPYLNDYLDIFSDDVKDMENGGRTYYLMRSMINWSIYFHKLDESGVHQVKLEKSSDKIPGKNADGLTSVKSLSEWCDSTADRLGIQFEKVREKFHYEAFKNNYRNCAGV